MGKKLFTSLLNENAKNILHGEVYIIFYPIKDQLPIDPFSIMLNSHSAIIIDFINESTENIIIGYQCEMKPGINGESIYSISRVKLNLTANQKVLHIGRLYYKARHYWNPYTWAISVTSDIARVYNNMINRYGQMWGNNINCHTFCSLIIEKLGLKTGINTPSILLMT